MKRNWIVIADRAGARIFEHTGKGAPLTLITEIDHPEGRLSNQEIDSDKPGRSFQTGNPAHHAMDGKVSAKEHVLDTWVKSLAVKIEQAVETKKCDCLTLVAEPHFLGKLRASLTPSAINHVTGTINKDLCKVDQRELATFLEPVVSL